MLHVFTGKNSELKDNWVKVAAGVVVVGASLYLGYKLFYSSDESTNEPESTTAVNISLMQHEQEIMAMMPAVTTVTKFRSTGVSVESYLRSKVAEILLKNPWLTSRIIRSPGGGMHVSYEPFPDTPAQSFVDRIVDCHFQLVEDFELPEKVEFGDLVNKFVHLQVKKGSDCVNKNEVLFRVCLVQVKDSEEVVLVFSLSHVLGDGFTFYTLHNMLDRNTPVKAMEVVRRSEFLPELRRLLGDGFVDWVHSPLLFFGLIGCSVIRGPVDVHIMRVDDQWLQAQKEEFFQRRDADNKLHPGQPVSFVSTNDILTAWHNKLCKSDIQLMSMNLRNRSPLFTDSMAGNYENSMLYNAPEDACSPEAIRRSLGTYRNASGSVPGVLKTLRWNGSLTTNWCSFYKQIVLSDERSGAKCEHLLHLPICESADLKVWREGMVIFKMSTDTIGLLILTRSLTPTMLESSGVGKVVRTF